MWHSRPPPFMAKAILNFHFDYLNPSLITNLMFKCLMFSQTRFLHAAVVMPSNSRWSNDLVIVGGEDNPKPKFWQEKKQSRDWEIFNINRKTLEF